MYFVRLLRKLNETIFVSKFKLWLIFFEMIVNLKFLNEKYYYIIYLIPAHNFLLLK